MALAEEAWTIIDILAKQSETLRLGVRFLGHFGVKLLKPPSFDAAAIGTTLGTNKEKS